MASQLEQIRQYARGFLDDGEELMAAMTASPRGRNTATAAGGVGSMIGSKMVSRQVNRATAVAPASRVEHGARADRGPSAHGQGRLPGRREHHRGQGVAE